MNLERTKPETLAAAALDLTPSHFTAAHEYAERLNAALARLGLTDRLTLSPAPNTAIDELPAVVDVPLRKTLSVLMGKAQQGDASALATLEWTAQVAESIFAGLHARASVYPLALPSHESLATLSQGVDALLPRKISTGWSVASLLADPTCDGIDDGVSLVRLLCSAAADSVTELKDDNEGWELKSISALLAFPNVTRWEFGCEIIQNRYIHTTTLPQITQLEMPLLKKALRCCIDRGMNLTELNLPSLEVYQGGNSSTFGFIGMVNGDNSIVKLNVPNMKEFYFGRLCENCASLKEVITGITIYDESGGYLYMLPTCPSVEKIVFGTVTTWKMQEPNNRSGICNSANLIHLEFGQGTSASLQLQSWNPTSVLSDSAKLPIFLSNFKTYIAERLSEQGSGKTITLSQAVRDAIEGDPTIAQIITSKGWSISPAPSV